MLSTERKSEIAERIQERLQKKTLKIVCPMCQNDNFDLVDSYIRNDLQDDLTSVSIGGRAIPAAAIVCSNCGFISQHAIGALGLMPNSAKVDSPESETKTKEVTNG